MPAGANDKFTKSYSFLQKSLGATISDVATSLTLNNYTNIPTDTKVHFIIDRIDSNGNRTNSARELVSGICNGSAVTNLSRGLHGTTAQSHDAGAVVEFVLSGAAWNDLVDGILVEHNQDGTHSDINATSITATTGTFTNLTISGQSNDGWNATGGTHSVSTGYNSGNRSFEIATSTDLSGIVSPGMRYRVTRDTTPPTQCADLEASSSHYASKSSPTGITFTDDFTCEAWIKLESYASGSIVARRTSSTAGFDFRILSSGIVDLTCLSGGSDESIRTYQSVPLNKWVHVAANIDLSGGTGVIYIDGVSVPVQSVNPSSLTTLTQSGDLTVGAYTGGSQPFDGKLADVRVWSDIRTATEIRDNMYAYPSDTTGLVAHFKLNGDFTDASSNSNDLTAQNSAVATNADNPWNATEYGIITNVTSSTIQVFCPEGYGIPNETLTAPFYSTQSTPFGFPRDKGKWTVEWHLKQQISKSTPAQDTWYSGGTANGELATTIPAGAWDLSYEALPAFVETSGAATSVKMSLSTSSSSESDSRFTVWNYTDFSSAENTTIMQVNRRNPVTITSATAYYLIMSQTLTAADSIRVRGDAATNIIRAECAYL